MKPTRAGAALGAIALFGFTLGFLFALSELFLLVGMCVAILIFSAIYVFTTSPKLRCERRTSPPKLRAGTETRILLRLINSGRRTSPVLHGVDLIDTHRSAKITFGAIRKMQSLNVGYNIPAANRGILKTGPLTLTLQDPMGLCHKPLRLSSTASFLVRPAVIALPPIKAAKGTLLIHHSSMPNHMNGDDDFYALRPYRVGDELRKVNWKAAAKGGELLVRQDRDIEMGEVAVVLDTDIATHSISSFETAISAASSVSIAARSGGDEVHFYSSDTPRSLDLNSPASQDVLDERLALATPSSSTNIASILERVSRSRNGGTLIVIVGTLTPPIERAIAKCRYKYGLVVTLCCNKPSATSRAQFVPNLDALPKAWAAAVGAQE